MPTRKQPMIVPEEILSQDLWNKALNTLEVELRNSLDLTEVSRVNVLSKALKEAQQKRQLCAQKCWTFKKRSGEVIVLRDVVEKIIVWVEKFLAVGDAAMQFDPVHAAPAWAAFRFVLQMAVNDKKVLGETIENLETVSHLITRYAILEDLYLQCKSPARDQLEDMIVRLYAEILTFLAKARKYLQSSAKVRLVKSIIKFSEDEHMAKITVLDGQISRLLEVLTIDIQIDTANGVAAMHSLLSSLNDPIKRLLDQSSISAQVLQESEYLQLLQWLSPVPFSRHHKRHSESRIPGSGQWLLDHHQYVNWRNSSSSSIFLLHGILGSGKTSLASAVVDTFLRESSGQASPAPTAYFYCTKNSAEPERSNPDEIMRSILRQLTVSDRISSTIHERVLREFEHRQAEAKVDGFETRRLQASECVRIILDTTAANPATIVLDAVDEIESSSRHILLSAVTQIAQDSLDIVKIFVTSRDDSNVHALLPDALAVRIQKEHVNQDMDGFVHREVFLAIQNRRMLNGVVSDSLKQALTRVLIAGAGEMFIWATRQMENLCRLKTEADIRDAMRTLPKDTLKELYEADFARMSTSGQHTRSYARQLFSILLSAQEALSPEAIIQAMAKCLSQPREELTLATLFDICSNLVVLDSQLNVLRFAHISFQEFLATRAEFASCYIHSVAAKSCLDACLEGLPTEMEIVLSPTNNFHHYSALYWPQHCRLAMVNVDNESVTSKMREFIFDEGDVTLAFVDWMEEIGKFTKKMPNHQALAKELNSVVNSGGSPLFTACVFGLSPILDDLAVAIECDWNRTNDLGHSGVYLAAATGQEMVVQRLLQHEVNVNTLGGKYGHALHAACFGGHANTVKLLLEHGAEPKIGPRSALEYAMLAGHENIALLLLDGKFDVSNQAEYDSVFQQAAEAGFSEVLQCLQKKYASVYGDLGSSRCKAVQVAVFKGRMGVVERYMQKLNDPRTDMAKDAIATAALGGQDAMIEFLMEKGLGLNEEGVLGTPLRAASIMCHESTVRLLLRLGASLHVSSSFGEPLQAAAMRGHEAITRALLSHGADVNNEGGLYGTALQAAAHRGHGEVVEILLDAGADVHREGFSRDAFHAASEGGHERIVRLLLDKGYKAQHTPPEPMYKISRPSPYRNLLRDASPSRSLDRKPIQDHRPASTDWRERASVTNSSRVVEMIRGKINTDYGMSQSYRDHKGRTYNYPNDENYPVRSAAAKGHFAVVELLLGQFDELNMADSEIVAAFQEACQNGHEKVAAQLLSDRIDAEAFKEALKAAALQGHLSVVNLLINHEEMLGLARVESTAEFRIIFPDKRRSSRKPPKEHYHCDSTARLILDTGRKGCHLPIFRRGQDLVAQRCTDVVSRHLYGRALITAAANGRADVMKAVFERITDLNFKELTETLKSVCAWGDEETLLLVLNRDAKKLLGVPQYSSGLSQASQKDNRPLVVYWLEKHPERQNIVVDPVTLIDVSENGFMDILPMLIQHSRPTDSFKKKVNQCLQAASRNGHEETVQYLVRKGANVNTAVKETRYTSEGDRRLGHKLSHEFYDENATTRKLSALQAALLGFERFNSKPELGYFQQQCQSAWIGADILSQQRCVEILLARGADPNRANKYNRYPLNIAAAYCTAELVQKLISSGARVRAATKKHGTALEAAARRETGGLPIIKAILEAQEAVSSIDLRVREAAALSKALSFFEGSDWASYGDDGRFRLSRSITDVLSTGPGAVVKILLARLSDITTDDPRYGLLFQMACMAGDRECVELLLQRGIDVNRTGSYYGTALQAASRVGNIEIVDHLLDSGANVNILGGAHGTALRAAVLGGHEDIVRRLLACDADVNLSDEDNDEDRGDSVLHLALKSRSDAIFKALFVAGAAVSTANSNQRHILITACKQGHAAVVDLLLASGVDVNISETQPEYYRYTPDNAATPLIAACAEGHPSVVRLLLAYGANIEKTNDSSATPLMAAIKGNNLSIVRLLLDAHADVNHAVHYPRRWQSDVHGSSWLSTPSRATAWDTPLSEAAQNGKLEIVEDFLSAGAIIGGPLTQRNSLAAACNNRQHMVVELLLETFSGSQYEAEICGEALSEIMEGGDPQTICLLLERVASPSFDLLRQACSAGVLEAVEMLVNTGIDVNENDGVDAPLLHVAASHSRPEIVQYLLDRGANVILRSPIYGSPLIAALEGSVALFVRCHSQPESCQSLAKQLPFPEAMHDFYSIRGTKIRQCEQVVQSLFEAGAEMDTTVRTFGSALHLASYLGSQEIVRYLLQGMDDINIFGGYFESPLIAAVTGNHAVIAELLLDRGVNVGRSSPEHGSALRCACTHGSMKLIRSLLDRGADVNADDDENQSALASAVSSYADSTMQGKDTKSSEERRKILEMLLGHEPKVHIRECDLLAAISSDSSNYGNRPDLTSLFLRHDESAVATETVLIEAIRNSTYRLAGFEALESLLKRDGGLGTTPAMLEAVESGEVMRLLLEHQPDCHITADVVLDLIGKGWGRLKILKILLECRKTVEFTAEIRKALDEKFECRADQEAESDEESQSQSDREAALDEESQSKDDQSQDDQSQDDQKMTSNEEFQSQDDQEIASDKWFQSEDDQETVKLFYKLERRHI